MIFLGTGSRILFIENLIKWHDTSNATGKSWNTFLIVQPCTIARRSRDLMDIIYADKRRRWRENTIFFLRISRVGMDAAGDWWLIWWITEADSDDILRRIDWHLGELGEFFKAINCLKKLWKFSIFGKVSKRTAS